MTVSGQSNAVSYSYDNGDRLTQISQGSASVSFGYDATGRRTSLTLPNGIVVGYSYDQGSQLTGLTHTLASNPLGNLAYGGACPERSRRDQNGRRIGLAGSWARTGRRFLPTPIKSPDRSRPALLSKSDHHPQGKSSRDRYLRQG